MAIWSKGSLNTGAPTSVLNKSCVVLRLFCPDASPVAVASSLKLALDLEVKNK